MKEKMKYIALLRGINVGGHHKVPMARLREEMEKIACEDVNTLLNTGNIIFNASPEPEAALQKRIKEHLEAAFGFSIPVLIRTTAAIQDIFAKNPFGNIEVTKETRLYISFLMDKPEINITLPWISEDKGYQILEIRDKAIYSVLNLAISKTPKGMKELERFFGKEITTRNLNTVKRIVDKVDG